MTKRTRSIVICAIIVLTFRVLPTALHAAESSPSQSPHLAERETENEDQGEQASPETDGRDDMEYSVPAQTTLPTTPTTTQEVPTTLAPHPTEQQVLLPMPTATTAREIAPAPKISTAFPWAWVVTRASGISSYILLAMLSITGILLTTGVLYRIFSPASAWSVHRAIATMLLFSVVAHIIALFSDRFIPFSLPALFIPFLATYRSPLVALGIMGMYLLLLTLLSSLYTITSHPKFWRTIHFLGFPMFILIFLHGVLIGTDTKQPWMIAIYWITAGLVVAGVVYRLVWKYATPGVPQSAKQ